MKSQRADPSKSSNGSESATARLRVVLRRRDACEDFANVNARDFSRDATQLNIFTASQKMTLGA